MQIFVNGEGEKMFAPDQIVAGATFSFHADTYDEALKGGVEKVKHYIEDISEATDFKADDFKTQAYSVQERFHVNRIEPKTELDLDKNLQKRVSDGFFFTQYVCLKFDYDKMRLAKLLAISSKVSDAPMLRIDFTLKDMGAKNRELIASAYADAKAKAETLAMAANKELKDCVRVEIDGNSRNEIGRTFRAERAIQDFGGSDFEEQIRNIDETFKPDDIILSKEISCVWETVD